MRDLVLVANLTKQDQVQSEIEIQKFFNVNASNRFRVLVAQASHHIQSQGRGSIADSKPLK